MRRAPQALATGSKPSIHPLRFLLAFARDISQPIARDGREHIKYVPTQIVTEYFRRVFRFTDALRVAVGAGLGMAFPRYMIEAHEGTRVRW